MVVHTITGDVLCNESLQMAEIFMLTWHSRCIRINTGCFYFQEDTYETIQ
jgi:hypothetical protein